MINQEDQSALTLWKDKLEFFLREAAIESGPAQRFELDKRVKEAKDKIEELEARSASNGDVDTVSLPASGSRLSYLHIVFAAILPIGAALASLSLLGVNPEDFGKHVISIVTPVAATTLAFLVYSRHRRAASGPTANALPGYNQLTVTRETSKLNTSARTVHRMVVFMLWSVLACSVVYYLLAHTTRLLLISLSPLWVGVGAFIATWIARTHRLSTVLLGGLFCGSFGAWLASEESTAMLFGFNWGFFTGALAADYLFAMDPYMSLRGGVLGTLIFLGSVALMTVPYDDLFLPSLHNIARGGLPYLMMEGITLLAGYLSHNLLRPLISTIETLGVHAPGEGSSGSTAVDAPRERGDCE